MSRVEHFQEQLLKCKDARMGIVGEVLNSMRVIKYYAWEGKFTNKVWTRIVYLAMCSVAEYFGTQIAISHNIFRL